MEFKVGEGFHGLPRRILDVLVHLPRLRHDFARFLSNLFERFLENDFLGVPEESHRKKSRTLIHEFLQIPTLAQLDFKARPLRSRDGAKDLLFLSYCIPPYTWLHKPSPSIQHIQSHSPRPRPRPRISQNQINRYTVRKEETIPTPSPFINNSIIIIINQCILVKTKTKAYPYLEISVGGRCGEGENNHALFVLSDVKEQKPKTGVAGNVSRIKV